MKEPRIDVRTRANESEAAAQATPKAVRDERITV